MYIMSRLPSCTDDLSGQYISFSGRTATMPQSFAHAGLIAKWTGSAHARDAGNQML